MIAWSAPEAVLPLAAPYGGLKDPCVVAHGGVWHLFATGCKDGFTYDLVHATAPTPRGPWRMHAPSRVDTEVVAPGVVSDGTRLHLYVQDHYNVPGGTIRHYVSDDGGESFAPRRTVLTSRPGTGEAGLYDAHPALVGGRRYLVYSGFGTVGEPDLYLARARSWDGPWQRLGRALRHEDVPCHNPRGCPDYEWGLEGAQLVELPDGRTLLLGVCFLPAGDVGTRQRVFLATAERPEGPYTVLGPAIEPARGENGHGCAVLDGDDLQLFFQHRDGDGLPWTISVATTDVASLADSEEEAA